MNWLVILVALVFTLLYIIGHYLLVEKPALKRMIEITEASAKAVEKGPGYAKCACGKCTAIVHKGDYSFPFCMLCYTNPDGVCT
jgi:hypothetical protein